MNSFLFVEDQFLWFSLVQNLCTINFTKFSAPRKAYIYIRDVISNYENDKMKSQQTSHFPLISLFTKIETNGNK